MEREYRVVVHVGDIFENILLEKFMGSFDTEYNARMCAVDILTAESVFGFEELDKIVNTAAYAEVVMIESVVYDEDECDENGNPVSNLFPEDKIIDLWDIPIYS